MTFAGSTSVTLAPGAVTTSDPVDLDVPRFADLAVSLHVAEAETNPPCTPRPFVATLQRIADRLRARGIKPTSHARPPRQVPRPDAPRRPPTIRADRAAISE